MVEFCLQVRALSDCTSNSRQCVRVCVRACMRQWLSFVCRYVHCLTVPVTVGSACVHAPMVEFCLQVRALSDCTSNSRQCMRACANRCVLSAGTCAVWSRTRGRSPTATRSRRCSPSYGTRACWTSSASRRRYGLSLYSSRSHTLRAFTYRLHSVQVFSYSNYQSNQFEVVSLTVAVMLYKAFVFVFVQLMCAINFIYCFTNVYQFSR